MRSIHRFLLVPALALSAACGSAAPPAVAPAPPEVAPATPATPAAPPAIPKAARTSSPLRFAVIGDFGVGSDSEYEVADRMCRWRKKHPFDLVITTGDNIYPDGAAEHFRYSFFEPFKCLLDAGVRFRSTLGNHDVISDGGRSEIDEPAFGIRKRNYVVRKGGVRFVLIDSNRLRMRWIKKALNTRKGDRWTVVAFHFPVFSGGTGHGPTPGFADKLAGLFQRKGVDFVLNGHDHVYSLSKKLGGIRYVVTGGGGALEVGCADSVVIARCVARLHFLYVRAGSDRLKVQAVPRKGKVFSRFRTKGVR